MLEPQRVHTLLDTVLDELREFHEDLVVVSNPEQRDPRTTVFHDTESDTVDLRATSTVGTLALVVWSRESRTPTSTLFYPPPGPQVHVAGTADVGYRYALKFLRLVDRVSREPRRPGYPEFLHSGLAIYQHAFRDFYRRVGTLSPDGMRSFSGTFVLRVSRDLRCRQGRLAPLRPEHVQVVTNALREIQAQRPGL